MCLFIYISSWKSLFKYESCFLSIKNLSLHLVSRGNVEGIIFFNLTIVEDKHVSFFLFLSVSTQEYSFSATTTTKIGKSAKLKPFCQVCMQGMTWFISSGNFIFVHAPSIEKLPKTELKRRDGEIYQTIYQIIFAVCQSHKHARKET